MLLYAIFTKAGLLIFLCHFHVNATPIAASINISEFNNVYFALARETI